MAIEARSSDYILSTEYILSKVSEYDIFRFYCTPFDKLGTRFKSELREDNSPTVNISLHRQRLLYKDFGHPDHSLDCFGYIMVKYGISFREALIRITEDFGLGYVRKRSQLKAVVHGIQPKFVKRRSKISVKKRGWNQEDKKFWQQFGISKDLLIKFGVSPLSYFWINEIRFKCNTISYVYNFKNGHKIYCPFEKEHKWYSTTTKECIQGYAQLPKDGETIFITSSLKDIMCLEVLGYPSIALQSEMQMPEESLLQELKSRFTNVYVLLDNDYDSDTNPGQTMADKICDKYKLVNVCIPDSLQSKDISDLIKNHSLHIAKTFITNSLPHEISLLHRP